MLKIKFNQFLVCSGLLFLLPAFAADAPLTRAKLFEGAEFPERREFAVSEANPPCKDFYQYACHEVISHFKLREDRSSHTFSFGDQAERLLQAKKNFMKVLPSLPNPSPRAQAMKNIYAACMNEDAGKAEEKDLVKNEVTKISAIKNREEMQKLVSDRVDQPEQGFVTFFDFPNQDDPNWEDIGFDSDVRTFPENSYYENASAMKDLEELATDFFKTIKLSNPKERAQSVIAYEKAVSSIYPQPAEQRERMSQRNSVTRAELTKKYPALGLDRFLKRLPNRVKFRDLIPEGLVFANKELSEGDLERLKNVLLFHSVSKYMDDAYASYFKKKFDFSHKHLGGPAVRPVREERCTKLVVGQFSKELDAEMLPILFPQFPKEKVITLADQIRSALIANLKENKWLSKGAKKEAMAKMKGAKLLLVSPNNDEEWYFNPDATYSPTQKYANSKLLNKNLMDRQIAELSKKRSRSRWLMSPLEMNAYYIPMDNVFVLPIAILQYPFFDPALPMETNLAAIGSVIGHELGHGIDDKGALYDQSGKLRAWMTPKDLKNFHERGDQFVERFNKLGHNGKLTLGENIGDHVGITTAYRAAFHGKSPTLEAKKAFFVQYARAWCNVMRPAYREMMLKTNPHAMGEARVNEQVRHLPDFQTAFSCKAGDPMYLPVSEQIKVW